MRGYPLKIKRVIENLQKLPGIGVKTAERLAMSLLRRSKKDSIELAESIKDMVMNVKYCSKCRNFSESDVCDICSSPSREKNIICVVEQPEDFFAIERAGEYRGIYFILHGSISPIEGIGAEELGIDYLVKRVKNEGIREVIIATDPDVSGEATAIYIARLLQDTDAVVSRIALGIPAGGHIGYADEITMIKALEGRRRIILE
ncbi:recombination protein RecR [Thermotomaculum hydrothermale]|uniref:Recombination protein RecR n=1 Tax=Thermotomaculum hydrothermale TaxID=981385 RepID=A0A7R6SZQ5_9BACT|nr:recombination mediator RecR [Thermotomaculum hydrothermale]BBB32987.1 recombination protein RecR [Thermotomaculum hydrothermale]